MRKVALKDCKKSIFDSICSCEHVILKYNGGPISGTLIIEEDTPSSVYSKEFDECVLIAVSKYTNAVE